jgi:hypothetical protein
LTQDVRRPRDNFAGLFEDAFRGIGAREILLVNQDWSIRHAELRALHVRQLFEMMVDKTYSGNASANEVDCVTHGGTGAGSSATHSNKCEIDLGRDSGNFFI